MTLTAAKPSSTALDTATTRRSKKEQKAITQGGPFADSRQQLLAAIAYVDLRVRWAVARARAHGLDPDDEFRGLYISEEHIDDLLDHELGALWPNPNGSKAGLAEWPAALSEARRRWQARSDASREQGISLLLNELVANFALSPLEVDVLLIALAPEVDPRYERIFAYLQDDVTKKRPSVDLVLNLLTDSFEEKLDRRRLLRDQAPLIESRLLVRFSDGGGREPALLSHFLRPAANVAEHLLGNPGLDEQLVGAAHLSWPEQPCPWLAQEQSERLGAVIESMEPAEPGLIFAFRGGYGVGKRAAAEHVAMILERPLISLNLAALGESEVGLVEGLRLALRDGRLLSAVVYLDHWDGVLTDNSPPDRLFDLLADYPGMIITAGEEMWQPAGRDRERRVMPVAFDGTNYHQRLRIWQLALAEDEIAAEKETGLAQLANQFLFTPGQIEDVVATARDLARWNGEPLCLQDLFAASRAHSNQKLVALATKIVPRYRWDDIVLPSDTLAQLREMVNTVRQRPQVYEKWGFGRKLALGKGLSALFAGESGTGKTMAADIMAGELGQDLYKIDLSMLVSKYIGETEKNLNRVFTEAETSNAILFFDEADAIFGKRSEVKDSHDRYANIEISYLLQRMEAYDGVVILASNLRGNLDEAFTRRLHFIVEFPFPEAADREIIWRVNFPPETPIAKDVDFRLLARRFRLAGGNIRNIIMAAAFLAAEQGDEVSMVQLLHATRREFQKIGRLIDDELFVLVD
ncbi:MAG: ATP-binding protein [Chloroflexota bacterium]|jgi:AAA+ superfamily predicted ATPase